MVNTIFKFDFYKLLKKLKIGKKCVDNYEFLMYTKIVNKRKAVLI